MCDSFAPEEMTMFDDFGVWLYTMTNEDVAGGGLWVIGDNPHDTRDGYPGRNAGEFKVKSWLANPVMYSGDLYKKKTREDTGEWEYMRAFRGVCICHIFGKNQDLHYPIIYPSEGVDVPPATPRSWELPPDRECARGVSILRKLDHPRAKAGTGPGYEFLTWQTQTAIGLAQLADIKNIDAHAFLYIETFHGDLYFRRCLNGRTNDYHLQPGSHAFITAKGYTIWNLNRSEGRGIAIFF